MVPWWHSRSCTLQVQRRPLLKQCVQGKHLALRGKMYQAARWPSAPSGYCWWERAHGRRIYMYRMFLGHIKMIQQPLSFSLRTLEDFPQSREFPTFGWEFGLQWNLMKIHSSIQFYSHKFSGTITTDFNLFSAFHSFQLMCFNSRTGTWNLQGTRPSSKSLSASLPTPRLAIAPKR